MTDPFDKATSSAPPTVGEGCLSRFDPEALTPEDGADFAGAAQLWEDMKPEDHVSNGEGLGGLDPQ